jgi:hypothetical protein
VVFYGADPMDTGIDVVLQGFDQHPTWTFLGVQSTGDINGDGLGDIIATQPGAVTGGRVLVYLGNSWMSGQPSIRWDMAAGSLANCGDINGDGIDDMMFGTAGTNNCGCVEIWAGDSSFVVAVPDEPPAPVPQNFRLLPPYPNPFNSSVTIPFEVIAGLAGDLNLKIFNVLGQEVVDITGEARKQAVPAFSGIYRVEWDGTDAMGQHMGSGLYLVELSGRNSKQVRKVVLLR